MNTPNILLIHGLADDSSVWTTLAEHLKQHFSIHYLPTPGHSRAAEIETQEDIVNTVVAEYDALKLSKPFVVGHSLGAAMAVVLATQRDVSGIVMLDQPIAQSNSIDLSTGLENAAKIGVKPAILEQFAILGIDKIINHQYQGNAIENLTYKSLNTLWSGTGPDAWTVLFDMFRSLQVPSYALEFGDYGDAYDQIVSASCPLLVREKMPGAKHHWFFIDQPKETAELVTNFYSNAVKPK